MSLCTVSYINGELHGWSGSNPEAYLKSDRPPLVERDPKYRTPPLVRGQTLLEGAFLDAPKIFWETTGTPYHYRYKTFSASVLATAKPPSQSAALRTFSHI